MKKAESTRRSNSIFAILLLSFLVTCQEREACTPAAEGAYTGRGFLFTTCPSPGVVCQCVFLPVCSIDSLNFKKSIREENMMSGINFGIVGHVYKNKIKEKSWPLKMLNTTPDSKIRHEVVMISPVLIKYRNAKDVTKVSTGLDKLPINYTFEEYEINEKYFYTPSIDIDTIMFLNYKP